MCTHLEISIYILIWISNDIVMQRREVLDSRQKIDHQSSEAVCSLNDFKPVQIPNTHMSETTAK